MLKSCKLLLKERDKWGILKSKEYSLSTLSTPQNMIERRQEIDE